MSHTFRQVDREALFLLPPSLDDWLPEGHLARFIFEIVAQLDLTSIKAACAGRSFKAHHPEMLLALLLQNNLSFRKPLRGINLSQHDFSWKSRTPDGASPDRASLALTMIRSTRGPYTHEPFDKSKSSSLRVTSRQTIYKNSNVQNMD